jgi:hypothetical protein
MVILINDNLLLMIIIVIIINDNLLLMIIIVLIISNDNYFIIYDNRNDNISETIPQ